MFNSFEQIEPVRLPVPKGCEYCAPTGFTGRTAIYEIVRIDEHMRRLIHGNASEFELENFARRHAGSIREDGLSEVLPGKT
ncbi:ATPase, T2SS/T4P/T4SS family, partial [Klebsiella pneumoniae]|uniref:ATPase, T2SS/T4P/T4SS family n=1 Tax=Klebsiella pneumoniae TaxID=573 RepID=UPI003F79460A